jgi:hypothetical protein
MKKIFFVIILLSLTACLTEPKKNRNENTNSDIKIENNNKSKTSKKNGLEFFKLSEGKYPSEIKLFDNTDFVNRLKKLIGYRYDFLEDYWSIEMPIEFKNGIYIIEGCEKHNCGWTNFIVTYDLTYNHLSVGIRDERKVKIFSEKSYHPLIIDEWEKEL